MNRLLLFTLLLVACKQKPIEQLPTTDEKEAVVQDTIAVSDIHRTDSLWSSFSDFCQRQKWDLLPRRFYKD